ncbi:MAG TPA: hypothetical protein VHY91_09020 [Pirellulales bacterium]|jgi:hypothetical protein|nr:hypothetical protein [Pirellulales bacterium]
MLRRRSFVLALGIVAALTGTLRAQQQMMDDPFFAASAAPAPEPPPKENWWQRWKRDYHRNQCWPEPFIAGDRAAVNAPFQIMADNAWQLQNLLSDYHFVEGTTELNEAGKHKLLWIITKAPTQRRAVFVESLPSNKTTAERIMSVRRTMVAMAPNYAPLPIYVSSMASGGWSGETAAATQRNVEKTYPDPRLPTATRTQVSQ